MTLARPARASRARPGASAGAAVARPPRETWGTDGMALEQLAPIAPTAIAPPEAPSARPYRDVLAEALAGRRATLDAALLALSARADDLAAVAASLVGTLRGGHKVLVAGNGGSAAEAQHFAAELVGRFQRERGPYAALALTADTAMPTAVANDYGYADVFARQVRAFGQ